MILRKETETLIEEGEGYKTFYEVNRNELYSVRR